MDTSVDISLMLQNASLSFRNEAARCREGARAILADRDDATIFKDVAYKRLLTGEADAAEALAKIWDERERTARGNFCRFGKDEVESPDFLNRYKDLVSACRLANRLVGDRPIDRALDTAKGAAGW